MEGNGKPIRITGKKTAVSLDPVTGRIRVSHKDAEWAWASDYEPGFFTAKGNRLLFSDALEQEHTRRETGLGQEIVSRYSGFPGEREIVFETRIWMEEASGALQPGLPVPLFNLVYHDCVIQPWMMEKTPEGGDYMLYALLNAGAPYLERDPAYPNIDGAFGGGEEMTLDERIRRCRTVSALQRETVFAEMLLHEFVDGDPHRQRTVFSNGWEVRVNTREDTWEIWHDGICVDSSVSDGTEKGGE